MRPETLHDYHQRMLLVLLYIQQHLDRPLELSELAGVANFSEFHFHRMFRGMMGESVQAHLRRLRLERAALRLRDSDAPVIQIALGAGFESHAAFSRAFKKQTGCSPTDWRLTNRRCELEPSPTGVHYGASCEIESFEPLTAGGQDMKVGIADMETRKVAFVRHIGPYNQCGKAWETLCRDLGPRGLLAGGKFIGLSHDDPEVTPPERLRYDACVTVGDDFEAAGPIGVQELPAGRYAVTTHHGPYDNLKDTYNLLFGQWMPANGEKMTDGPSQEYYLNDPESTEPAELLTDIYILLEER